jgi:hypothetical protein
VSTGGYSGHVSSFDSALRGATHVARVAAPVARRAIVAGAGGALGSAVLERFLADAAFADVLAVVERTLARSTLRLHGLPLARLRTGDAAGADTAVIVFDRARGRHGREDVFHRPAPGELAALARDLHGAGARHLVVVLPHAPARLPHAFKLGLASLDEQAVAALGFEHVVLVRSAQRPGEGARAASWLQRVADGVLAQLHWMVPQREQPVRADRVAAFVAALARALPRASPGTRVVPPEVVWQAAQPGDVGALVAQWLAGAELAPARLPRQRW